MVSTELGQVQFFRDIVILLLKDFIINKPVDNCYENNLIS